MEGTPWTMKRFTAPVLALAAVLVVLALGGAPASPDAGAAAVRSPTGAGLTVPGGLGLHADARPRPTKQECSRAKKILSAWERLAQKYGVNIGAKRIRELRRKTQDGTIRLSDLPAKLRREFPDELSRYNLNQITNICNGLPPGNGSTVTV